MTAEAWLWDTMQTLSVENCLHAASCSPSLSLVVEELFVISHTTLDPFSFQVWRHSVKNGRKVSLRMCCQANASAHAVLEIRTQLQQRIQAAAALDHLLPRSIGRC